MILLVVDIGTRNEQLSPPCTFFLCCTIVGKFINFQYTQFVIRSDCTKNANSELICMQLKMLSAEIAHSNQVNA